MAVVTITERASLTSASKVDRKTGRVSEVKLLGRVSKNGRRYTDGAMEQAARLYPGKPIYKDHGENPGDERGALEEIAVVAQENVRFIHDAGGDSDKDGVFGPVDAFIESEYGRRFLEQAEKAPHLFGMSHDVEAEMSTVNGVTEITKIIDVNSVDAVKRPATTKALHESEDRTVKLSKFFESVKQADPLHAVLAEAVKTRGDFELPEKATPQAAVIALMAEKAVEKAPANDPAPTGDAAKLVESIKPTLDKLAGEIKSLADWRRGIEVRESAVAVLEEHGIEPRPELIKELRTLESQDAMNDRIALWPDYIRDPQRRPIVENIREDEEGDAKPSRYSLTESMKRWGVDDKAA